jgi:hypothetical protein
MTDSYKTAKLRETDRPFTLHSFEEDSDAITRLVSQAEQELRIFSHQLNNAVFGASPLIESVSAFARKNSHTSIRILITDVRSATSGAHQFLNLARKQTTAFECRKVNSDYAQQPEEFILVDRCGYVRFPRANHFEAITNFHDPVKVRQLGVLFQEIWDCSESDPELISFSI